MLPCSSQHDLIDVLVAGVVLGGKLALRHAASIPSTTDLGHLLGRELGAVMLLTKTNKAGVATTPVIVPSLDVFGPETRGVSVARGDASFLGHVGEIVGVRPEPEVAEARSVDAPDEVDAGSVVPDAARIVAGVADGHALRHRPSGGKPPCDPMGGIVVVATASPESPVPELLKGAIPLPAGTEISVPLRLGADQVDLGPESVGDCRASIRVHQVSPSPGVTPRTVAAVPGLCRVHSIRSGGAPCL
jgi:hypothetical protein